MNAFHVLWARQHRWFVCAKYTNGYYIVIARHVLERNNKAERIIDIEFHNFQELRAWAGGYNELKKIASPSTITSLSLAPCRA